jgi:hypothetical protein
MADDWFDLLEKHRVVIGTCLRASGMFKIFILSGNYKKFLNLVRNVEGFNKIVET